MNLLSNLTRRQETSLRLNGVWALMVGIANGCLRIRIVKIIKSKWLGSFQDYKAKASFFLQSYTSQPFLSHRRETFI